MCKMFFEDCAYRQNARHGRKRVFKYLKKKTLYLLSISTFDAFMCDGLYSVQFNIAPRAKFMTVNSRECLSNANWLFET